MRTILDDDVPSVYKWQVQVGLLVTGRSWLDFISYCPGADLYVKRVRPDKEAFGTIHMAVSAAEAAITSIIADYTESGKNRVKTEWFDPFEEEVEITF